MTIQYQSVATEDKQDVIDTVVDAVKVQTDKIPRIESIVTMWGGIEDELVLKNGADPAAPAAVTKFTPDIPASATITRAFLLMMFREITCAAAANYVSTAGVVQTQKSGGSWLSGITIPVGTLDVASGAVTVGGVLIGKVDVKAQVEDGVESEFKLITLRSNADDLLLRDVQFGLQMYFIP